MNFALLSLLGDRTDFISLEFINYLKESDKSYLVHNAEVHAQVTVCNSGF